MRNCCQQKCGGSFCLWGNGTKTAQEENRRQGSLRFFVPAAIVGYSAPFSFCTLFKRAVLLLAVLAAVGLRLLIRQIEDVGQLLLDGGDAAGILAVDYIGNLFGEL